MSTNNTSSNNLANNGETEGAGESIKASPHQRQRQPSLLESLMVEPAQNATDVGFGILCNDPSGLCLSATGNFIPQNNSRLASMDDTINSGVYTSLTKLAQQLQPGSGDNVAPLITIETEESNLLVKEYDGHAIAMKVPAAIATSSSTNGGGTGGDPSNSNGAEAGGGPSN